MNANGFDRELGSKAKQDWSQGDSHKKNQPKQQDGSYKVREFEWFEVETKIRKFVNELLQPTIMKISLEKKTIEEVNEKIQDNNATVKSLYDIIHYNGNKVKVLDDIYEKISLTNTSMEILSNKTKQREEKMEQFQQHILEEYSKARTEIREVQKVREQFEEDKHILMEYFENFKKNTQQIITSLTKELSQSQNQSKQEFQKTWESISKIETNISLHSSDIKTNQNKIADYFERVSTLTIKAASMDSNIDYIGKSISELQANINIAKKFTFMVEDLQNKFKMVENYVEKYSGLFVQGQISETLFSCLDKSSKRKLVAFEEKVFGAMNQRILNDDGEPNLEKRIKESISFVETIIKRNAKFQHLKKKDSADDLGDSMTNENMSKKSEKIGKDTSKERKNEGDNQEKQTVIVPIKEQNEVSSKPDEKKEDLHRKEDVKLVTQASRTSVNSSGSNCKSDVVSNRQFSQLKQLIEMEILRMKEQINNRTSGLSHSLVENEEMVQLNIQKIQEELESGISLLRKQQNSISLETGALDNKIQSVWGELSKIVNTFNILSETVHKLIHFNTLSNSLVLQDELDKQSIALFGYKTSFLDDPKNKTSNQFSNPHNPNNFSGSPIQMDEKCLSCSGQTAQIAQTFKIACLAYHPSSVLIEGQQYKREEILEVATRLLQAARQQYGLKDNPKDINQLNSPDSLSQNRLDQNILINNENINLNDSKSTIPLEQLQQQQQSERMQSAKANKQLQLPTQNSLTNNDGVTYSQNSQNSIIRNPRYLSIAQTSYGDQTNFTNNSSKYSSSNMQNYLQGKKVFDTTNSTEITSLSPFHKPQNILPQLEGLKPRSRAVSKKPGQQNNSRIISSSQYRRENTQQ